MLFSCLCMTEPHGSQSAQKTPHTNQFLSATCMFLRTPMVHVVKRLVDGKDVQAGCSSTQLDL